MLDMGTPVICRVKEAGGSAHTHHLESYEVGAVQNNNPDSVELVIDSISKDKANAKGEPLQTLTLGSAMAYRLVFAKHLGCKAVLPAGLLGVWESPEAILFRGQQE